MLLKWLFTLLAILWLFQAIRPFFATTALPKSPPPDKPAKKRRNDDDDDGDYIDYEEIK
jgi:hypothetical protein